MDDGEIDKRRIVTDRNRNFRGFFTRSVGLGSSLTQEDEKFFDTQQKKTI